MIIATRTLKYSQPSGDVGIPVNIYAPEASSTEWICRFEIRWPEGAVERWGVGSDPVQALVIALQMIGAEVYASAYHDSGKLEWLSPGRGYGFPVASGIRDLLIGDDRRFF